MKHILTIEQTRNADEHAIKELGISSVILMENAARSAFEKIADRIKRNHRILILCGSGNNGGDGFALSRHFFVNGFSNLKLIFWGSNDKMSPETNINYITAKKIHIPIYENPEKVLFIDLLNEADVIVEALIGVGGNENLRGEISSILAQVNLKDAMKVAIDVPAGLNADTGEAHRNAFKADLTLTMFAPKVGMYVNEGPKLCGGIEICSLGAPTLMPNSNNYLIFDDKSIGELLGQRRSETDKFDYGRIVVIAGSESMAGAAALTVNSAIKSGAGLVELLTTSIHPAVLPEVISYKLKPNRDGTIANLNEKFITERIEKADTVVIGPGIGNNDSTITMLANLYDTSNHKKFVIDADGLRCLSKLKSLSENTIITPHIYEFSRLLQSGPQKIKANLLLYSNDFAKKMKCVVIVKSHPTIITNGSTTFFNTAGNPGMATAGSGDVLTGIIAGLSHQIKTPLLNASAAAYLHSRAGDLYAEINDQISLSASSLIDYLPQAIRSVYSNKLSE